MTRCICLTAVLFLGQALVCPGAATESQTADWTELRGADPQAVRALLQRQVDLRARDADSNSALHVAALHANAAAIELLLAAGVDVNGTNKYGATPLIYAAGDPKKVRTLLAHGADPNRASLLGTTPLIAAAGYPDSWFVRSRTWPFQPYFDSRFPHGKDQWISAAGTAWSILALLNTLDRAQTETAALNMGATQVLR
jgi:hypothetical protein